MGDVSSSGKIPNTETSISEVHPAYDYWTHAEWSLHFAEIHGSEEIQRQIWFYYRIYVVNSHKTNKQPPNHFLYLIASSYNNLYLISKINLDFSAWWTRLVQIFLLFFPLFCCFYSKVILVLRFSACLPGVWMPCRTRMLFFWGQWSPLVKIKTNGPVIPLP